jgi:Mg/Co/Ni transporter MgtE
MIRDEIAAKLVNEYFKALTSDDLLAMINASTPEQKQKLFSLVMGDQAAKAGELIRKGLIGIAKQQAAAEADRILAVNTLSDTDLMRLMK